MDVIANKSSHVRGKAVPGSQVRVRVTVEGTNAKGHANAGSVFLVKDWQTVTASSNGVWATPDFKFDAKDRVRDIKFHIKAHSKENPRNSHSVTVVGR